VNPLLGICVQAEKEAVRKILEQGSSDFSFGDKVESNVHEAMVHTAASAQILHLAPSKLVAAERLSAKHSMELADARPKHLQGGSSIHLGLGDTVVTVQRMVRRVGVGPQNNVRADPLTDLVVKANFPLQ